MDSAPLRHAYMIITHGNFPILERQLSFLDSENADFFIHVDLNAGEIDCDRFRAIPRRSRVTFVDRLHVSWGHYSLTECELRLLQAAAQGHYDYYHLLSGVDVPVKSRTYIENYFTRQPGVNYINLERPEISRRHLDRVRFYYPFQKWNIRNTFLRRSIRELTALSERIVGVDRTKKAPEGFRFQKATEWFSITDSLAQYVLTKEDLIYELFHDTFCSDEMFLPSIAVSSPFRDTIPPADPDGRHKNCCRYIDWVRGSPYTFREEDYEELVSTGPDYLFARKFDCGAAPALVDRLFEHFSG